MIKQNRLNLIHREKHENSNYSEITILNLSDWHKPTGLTALSISHGDVETGSLQRGWGSEWLLASSPCKAIWPFSKIINAGTL